jgi:ferredoxin
VEFLEVESLFDDQGNFGPKLRQGTEKSLEADTVLIAVGQSFSRSILQGEEDLERTPAGVIRIQEDLSTSVPGTFAGGDIFSRARGVVGAIADGQRAALSIHEYLSGRKLKVRRKGFMTPLDPARIDFRSEGITPAGPGKRPVGERIRSHAEIDLTYGEESARRQAERCRQCHVQTVFDRTRCILCGTCVDTCVKNALKMVFIEELEGDETFGRLTRTLRRKPTRGGRMTAIIKDEEKCVRCGQCAQRCPTGAITMEEFHFQEEWDYE